jgi:hypothetical protein
MLKSINTFALLLEMQLSPFFGVELHPRVIAIGPRGQASCLWLS